MTVGVGTSPPAPPTSRPLPVSKIGQQLYWLLPSVYRNRDNTTSTELGDLGRYLDACGELLDRVRATLDQRLADSFPDNPPPEKRACQEWLLPYFAQLVDARLVSPDARGRRDEIANAVSWRQRKGTVTCIEEIAESVADMEVEVQEGWKRVATTPRIGTPLLPPETFGVPAHRALPDGGFEERFDPRWPAKAARHPGLPAVTMDLRRGSGAVRTDVADAAGRVSTLGGVRLWWRQANPHGVPCAPGSYQDVSRRTVDVRTPTWSAGHAHPRRVLLFAPPPLGFGADGAGESLPGDVTLSSGERLEGSVVRGTVTVTGPGVVIDGCAIARLVVASSEGDATTPTATVQNSLIETIEADGTVQMEYCTVLAGATFAQLNASECVFAGTLDVDEPEKSCVRFSRVPRGSPVPLARGSGAGTNTSDLPVFQEFLFRDTTADGERLVRRPAGFGEPGCGVLHPATPESVRLGAEDGGEMGVFHAPAYALRAHAVLDKLLDFVPVGIEAVLIPDPYLHQTPPDLSEAQQ